MAKQIQSKNLAIAILQPFCDQIVDFVTSCEHHGDSHHLQHGHAARLARVGRTRRLPRQSGMGEPVSLTISLISPNVAEMSENNQESSESPKQDFLVSAEYEPSVT